MSISIRGKLSFQFPIFNLMKKEDIEGIHGQQIYPARNVKKKISELLLSKRQLFIETMNWVIYST